MAYILWEQAGKPDGADFGTSAREKLEAEIRAGKTIEQIELELRAPPSTQSSASISIDDSQKSKPQPVDAPQPSENLPSMGSVDFGRIDNIIAHRRDALTLIRKASDVPNLTPSMSEKVSRPLEPLIDAAAKDPNVKWRRRFGMNDGTSLFVSARENESSPDVAELFIVSDNPEKLVLHWGKTGENADWTLPPKEIWPAGSTQPETSAIAVESPFVPYPGDFIVPLQAITLSVPLSLNIAAIPFVVRSNDETRWWKDGARNFVVPTRLKQAEDDDLTMVDDVLLNELIEAESSGMWTLMHRYNKIADLLDSSLSGMYGNVDHALSKLFIVMRYSSVRQLTWQRSYNTQPRILSAAQERLTGSLSSAHANLNISSWASYFVRNMLTCVGRGGDGQRIRDQILEIMHRNHIKEVKGTWMEEWHQKLHNNTTPDDVPICEAYIAFLRSGGDNGVYWRHLADNGLSRERLESYDRAIRCEPEFFADKASALIGEFQDYLAVLKSVHSAAELTSAVKLANQFLPNEAKGYIGFVLAQRGCAEPLPLMEACVEARSVIAPHIQGNRELLYLDLALEAEVRGFAERDAGSSDLGAARLVAPTLQNLCLSVADNEELCYCLNTWTTLPSITQGIRPSKEEALRAAAVVERVRRALGTVSDELSGRLAKPASILGKSLGVDPWASDLFAEEIVRGSPAFAVSLVLSRIEPLLRSAADLGSWQIVSPANIVGRVVVASGLHEVQELEYDEPTIVASRQVTGEEEIPVGCVGVVTCDTPDMLSHVSVRARNEGVLLATCHDDDLFEQIEKLAGGVLRMETSSGGDVTYETVDEASLKASSGDHASHAAESKSKFAKLKAPEWCGSWVVQMDDFLDGSNVGAKSKNLAKLRGQLPSEVILPSSATVPFSSFENVLEGNRENHALRDHLKRTLDSIEKGTSRSLQEELTESRALVMKDLYIPNQASDAIQEGIEKAGISWPDGKVRWEDASTALKSVWASKFNERAFVSARKAGIKQDYVRMAVLIQEVVDAQYAFVIHTVHPTTRAQEIYAEMVVGLGETLVGNYAGSAWSYVTPKDSTSDISIVSYPSKSVALTTPASLIFRSDSNGEDLPGYAGAGLYDSVPMDEQSTVPVDYVTECKMYQEEGYRNSVMSQVASLGVEIEKAFGGVPQDIEGCITRDGRIVVVQSRPMAGFEPEGTV
ncbi:alpha-glucan, water dikinase [Pycnococcus provasolii]